MAKKKTKKSSSNPSRAEWEIEINLRAWRDPAFKKLLLKDPRAALEKLGCKSGLNPKKVKIVEEDAGDQIVVLYKTPKNAKTIAESELRGLGAAGHRSDDCHTARYPGGLNCRTNDCD